jgi:DNA-binding IclR family transcriptional regulator
MNEIVVTAEAGAKHTIPVLDRMMEVLGRIEASAAGLTIRQLTEALGLPRTTVYRILNTLQAHQVVRRDEHGAYHLGRRLVSLAQHVGPAARDLDLAAAAQPFLDRLAADLGEGVSVSVIDPDGVFVLAAAQGRREYALTVAPGQRMPVHAGAASKLLLAHLPEEEIDAWLDRPLAGYTPRTITDAKRLRAELARIRRQGWAADRGENGPSIQAYAAPVFDGGARRRPQHPLPRRHPARPDGDDPPRGDRHRRGPLNNAPGVGCASPTSAAP